MLSVFTAFHVILSLVGIVAGFVVLFGLLRSKRLDGWTMVFLATTAATSATGFLFPVPKFLPSHGVGILSLPILWIAFRARYRFKLAGRWRRSYAIAAVISLYLNFFVLIVQLFEKVPSLEVLAPTQSEPPFQAVQLAALLLFVVLAVRAAMQFRPETPSMA